MTHLQKFITYLKPYRKRIFLTLVAMSGVALMVGAYSLLIKNVVDDVLLSKRSGATSLLVVVILIVSIIGGICIYAQEYFSNYVGQRVVFDLRSDLYHHLLKLSPAFFTQMTTPNLLSRIINDVEVVQYVIRSGAIIFVREGISIIVLLGVAFYRDWFLALVSLFVFPVVALFIHRFGSRMRRLSKQRLEQLGTVTERLSQSLANLKIIQIFGRESYEAQRFQSETQNLFSRLMRITKTTALAGPAMDGIRGIGIAIILVLSSYQISRGKMSLGTFFSFATALTLLYVPLKRMVNFTNLVNEGIGALARIFEVLEKPPAVQDAIGARVLTPMSQEIKFEEVTFAYNREWELSQISFTVKAGEIVAFIGPSGAGKSTLMNLLLRFYDPIQGRILIDGQDIRGHTLASLRLQISWVSQENMLFNDTIRANIAYGRLDATDEEIGEAAQHARAAEFIEAFPQGYDTIIGENGLSLSGGERQRIAIARAFLKKAPILILDEATSSVDGPTELLIQEAIRDLVKDRTTLVIAHRPSTISLASKIVLLEQGNLIAVGDHRLLLEKHEFYKKLYRSQHLNLAG